ncbi:hypothetical protein MKY91_20645 [Alkalicoccobacillus gibsonii]|uniref:Uncharacterized protein n=1 Tax=Alkalicoccobacillus gibsonii TaxID=79881 RepID=A0ABU9VNT6_9BACI
MIEVILSNESKREVVNIQKPHSNLIVELEELVETFANLWNKSSLKIEVPDVAYKVSIEAFNRFKATVKIISAGREKSYEMDTCDPLAFSGTLLETLFDRINQA